MSPAAELEASAGVYLNFPITKINEELREIWGVATSEALDVQGEIVDYDAAKKAFQVFGEQFSRATGGESLGAVREMHQPKTVGKIIAVLPDDVKREISIGVKLSRARDGDDAWQKVKERVLNGFSIGAPTAERRQEFVGGKPVRRVVKLTLSELSLVDNPACPDAFFKSMKLAKSAGGLIEVNAAMGGIESTEPSGEAFGPVGLKPNAFVDGLGQTWKMTSHGVQKFEEPQAANAAKGAAMTDQELEKAGKKIGPHTRRKSVV